MALVIFGNLHLYEQPHLLHHELHHPTGQHSMFRPTPSLAGNLRRLALTTKNGPKDFYKGTRSGAMGRHTKRGGYRIMFEKVRTYVFPHNMKACTVRLAPYTYNLD
jgi:hypothetical protein